jgi:hypothetical protein
MRYITETSYYIVNQIPSQIPPSILQTSQLISDTIVQSIKHIYGIKFGK